MSRIRLLKTPYNSALSGLAIQLATVLLAPLPSTAAPAMTVIDQAHAFATCAGRFSALATHQGSHRDPDKRDSRQIVLDFMALLDATRHQTEAAGIDQQTLRQWRAAGWMEISNLFRLKKSHANTVHAQRAERTIQQRLSNCRGLIL